MAEAENLDALLAEVPDGDEPEQADATAQPDSRKQAELDALIPDSADIDEDFRGKPVNEVLRIASQHKHEIGVARRKSQEFNTLESRARIAEEALQWWKAQGPQHQGQPQREEETDEALLNRLSARPTEVLPEKIREYVEPLERQIHEQNVRLVRIQADGAREQARAALNMSPDMWEAITPQLAAITASRQWSIEDPNAWYAAGYEYVQNLERLRPPAPRAPAVSVPAPAAPPGGTARSQSRPFGSASRLKGRDLENASDILAGFGIKPDSKAFAEFEEYVVSRKRASE